MYQYFVIKRNSFNPNQIEFAPFLTIKEELVTWSIFRYCSKFLTYPEAVKQLSKVTEQGYYFQVERVYSSERFLEGTNVQIE